MSGEKEKEKIFHIITGGTIGGVCPEYAEVQKISEIFSDSVAFEKFITKSFQLRAQYKEETLCKKDSRDITQEDRSRIVRCIELQYSQGVCKFMLTHGTYTLPETAQYIEAHLNKEVSGRVRIVCTGAMYPWNLFGSDAPINIGAALGDLMNNDDSGVFILMHGKRFTPHNTVKDIRNFIFEEHTSR